VNNNVYGVSATRLLHGIATDTAVHVNCGSVVTVGDVVAPFNVVAVAEVMVDGLLGSVMAMY
jgi:hypothetical protein